MGSSETWLEHTISDDELSFRSYAMYTKDRQNGRGGGLLVYIPESCPSWRRSDLEEDSIEALWTEMRLNKRPLLLCNSYRPPGHSGKYLQHLRGMLEKAAAEAKAITVIGDLNYNILFPDAHIQANALMQLMEEHSLYLSLIHI